MISGNVRWFSLRRGYGFIIPDGCNEDVFIHISELHRAGIKFLIPGKRVGFDIFVDRGRKIAAHLMLM